jgi:regulator of replication initiation timing
MEKYIYLIAGLIIGATILYLWLKQRYASAIARLDEQLRQAKKDSAELEQERDTLNSENERLSANEVNLKTDLAEKVVEFKGKQKELESLETK